MKNSANAAGPSLFGLDRVEASIYIGTSPSEFDRLIEEGRMPIPMQIDRQMIWDVVKLNRSLIALQTGTGVAEGSAGRA